MVVARRFWIKKIQKFFKKNKKKKIESRYLSRETRSHSDRSKSSVVGPTRARFGSIAVGSVFPTEISTFDLFIYFFFKEFLYFFYPETSCNYHRRHFSGKLLSCSFPEGTSVFNSPTRFEWCIWFVLKPSRTKVI